MKQIFIHIYLGHIWAKEEKYTISQLFVCYCNLFINTLCDLQKYICHYPHSFIGSYNGTTGTIDILNKTMKQVVFGSYATASFLSSFQNFVFGLDQLLLPLNTDEQLPLTKETIAMVAGEASSTSRYAIDLLGWSAYYARNKNIPFVSIQEGIHFARENPNIDVYISAVSALPDDLPSNIFASESLLEDFILSEKGNIIRYQIIDIETLCVFTDSKKSIKTSLDSLNALGGKIDLSQREGIVDLSNVYNWAECIYRSVSIYKSYYNINKNNINKN